MRRHGFRGMILGLIIGVGVTGVGLLLSRAAEVPPGVILVRQETRGWPAWGGGPAVVVRLDLSRLRTLGLGREDVMTAMMETRMRTPGRAVPPPGVVLVGRLDRPERYAGIIVRATAEGEVVRLGDVATVEAGW